MVVGVGVGVVVVAVFVAEVVVEGRSAEEVDEVEEALI